MKPEKTGDPALGLVLGNTRLEVDEDGFVVDDWEILYDEIQKFSQTYKLSYVLDEDGVRRRKDGEMCHEGASAQDHASMAFEDILRKYNGAALTLETIGAAYDECIERFKCHRDVSRQRTSRRNAIHTTKLKVELENRQDCISINVRDLELFWRTFLPLLPHSSLEWEIAVLLLRSQTEPDLPDITSSDHQRLAALLGTRTSEIRKAAKRYRRHFDKVVGKFR